MDRPDDIINDIDIQFEIDTIAREEQLLNIRKKNHRLCARLRKKIPDFGAQTIYAMEKHKILLSKFLRADCFHATNVDNVVGNMGRDSILIYLTELGLYGIFTLENYLAFVKQIRGDESDDESARIEYTPKQVIMSNLPQKIVFMCSGTEPVVDKIKKYSVEHFKSDIDVVKDGDRTEVIVRNLVMKDYTETREKFADFLKFVNKYDSVDKLGIVAGNYYPLHGNFGYVISLMDGHREVETIDELVRKLNGGPITINFVHVHEGGVATFGANNIYNCTNIEDIAKKWIKANPPHHREKTTDYYNRYQNDNHDCIVANVFGPIVRNLGYQIKKSNGARCWNNE